MAQITLVRHAQASFGSVDYDRLSELGHEQARALGASLAAHGTQAFAKIYLGGQRRHRETLEDLAAVLGLDLSSVVQHEGLNEFNAQELLAARFGPTGLPEETRRDRRLYFRALRETVLAWQRDEIEAPPESWAAFSGRVARACAAMAGEDGDVLAVSSGGAISRMIVDVLGAPAPQMILMQLQMKNCAVSRLVVAGPSVFLHSFNEVPHLRTMQDNRLLTYA